MTTIETLRRPDTPPTQINEARTTCANSHPWVAENTRWRYRNRPEKQYAGWERDCLKCHVEQKRAARTRKVERRQTLAICIVCSQQMRPKNAPAKDWPHTVERFNSRACRPCYHAGRWRPLETWEIVEEIDHLDGNIAEKLKRLGIGAPTALNAAEQENRPDIYAAIIAGTKSRYRQYKKVTR